MDKCTLFGDIQDPPAQGPLQSAVGDPAPAGGLDYMTHRGPFQPLPFCDSVIDASVPAEKSYNLSEYL